MKEVIKKSIFIVLILLVIVGCGKKNKTTQDEITMIILGEENILLNVNEEYIEEGVIVLVNGIESDDKYQILGKVDNSFPGKYTITYKYKMKEIKRTVTVIDNIPPEIALEGAKSVVLVEGAEYKEYGYKAWDNIDGNITDKVIIIGEVKKTIGTYTLTYSVKDSSGNEASVKRTVKVNKKMIAKQEPKEEKIKQEEKPIVYNNEVINMTYTTNGFNLVGTNEKVISEVFLHNIATDERIASSVISTGNTYSSNIDLSALSNSTYNVYIVTSDGEELLRNNLNNLLRIKKRKLGDKLLTFNYTNNNVQIVIENHVYRYDILIDVGHGPTPGAVNESHIERDVNLTLSLYEKARYEAHGMRVLLTRTSANYPLGEGDLDWEEIHRRSYAMGLYGVQTKITYSNHHNSSADRNRMGPEIIVPATLASSSLTPEVKIMNDWRIMTGVPEINTRFWARNYDTGSIHTKASGEVYNFTNWYATIRIPYNLFNIKTVIFEPAFMSHNADWNRYWNGEHCKDMCEVKIKHYLESIGVTYIPPV